MWLFQSASSNQLIGLQSYATSSALNFIGQPFDRHIFLSVHRGSSTIHKNILHDIKNVKLLCFRPVFTLNLDSILQLKNLRMTDNYF